MASNHELLGLLNCTIRFSTDEGDYEGVIKTIFPVPKIITVGKLILLPDRRMGSLNFGFSELSNIKVISRPDSAQAAADDRECRPVYQKTEIEKLLDLDAGSDIEDDGENENIQQAAYEMKLVRHLSKFVPKDFEIIDSFGQEFSLAMKHIRRQDAIGVSLEGINVSRSGTLTWIVISTPHCNFLFDILSLGEQAFKKGLKSIFENAKVQKIFHDSRLPSDCLYHKYGVRLVNVFDTQVADFIVMMQMIEKEKINSRVNSLDACLNYYLEVPYDYLYGETNLNNEKDSLNFHALRPLRHEIQDVLIKNVMYLHLLKRELEMALLTPLRRATDVYLNAIQKLSDKEVDIVPHNPYELPLDMHLEGIQIFRYRDFDNVCRIAASGPPYREIKNPFQHYLSSLTEYRNGQKASQNAMAPSLELNNQASGTYQKSSKSTELKTSRVNSLDNSNDCENNYSMNYQEGVKHRIQSNPSLTVGNQKNIVNSKTSHLNESSTLRNPVVEPLKNVKVTSDEASQVNSYGSEISNERLGLDNEAVLRNSNANELANFKPISNPDNNSVTKDATFPHPRPTLGRMSQIQLLEAISKMTSTSATASADTSESVVKNSCEKESKEIDSLKNIQHLQMDDSVAKKSESISDSELEKVAARVRTRGALLRNCKTGCSTSDPSSGSAEFKPMENGGTSEKLHTTSEDVTICYSDVLDKPTQFLVKVNHTHGCLADLYRKAGDGGVWWTEESESVPKSSPSKPNESKDTEAFWAMIRGDYQCQPIDENLRSRLVPAGMAGY